MTHDLWRLAGPALFLERLLDLVREGKSVVITASHDAPEDMLERIVREIRSEGLAAFPLIGTDEPLALLGAQLLGQDLEPTLDAICDGCHGPQCFVVELMNAEHCAHWTCFVERLQHRARQNPASQRPILVLFRRGTWRGPLPREDVAVALSTWIGVVTEADFLSYAYALISSRTRPGLERRVLAHVLANIALWDVTLMAQLAKAPKRDLMEPGPLLTAYGRERKWSADGGNNLGSRAEVGGEIIEHSAQLAITGQFNVLGHRVWIAQSRVLLPWVEDMRLRLLCDFAAWLPKGPQAHDPREMEIGEIHFHLEQGRAPPRLKKTARLLRDVRNNLAHRAYLRYEAIQMLAAEFAAE